MRLAANQQRGYYQQAARAITNLFLVLIPRLGTSLLQTLRYKVSKQYVLSMVASWGEASYTDRMGQMERIRHQLQPLSPEPGLLPGYETEAAQED